jgi:hypothetical protein
MYSQAEAYGIKAAHSEYVTLLCDTGLVGLLLYAATVAASLGLAAKFLVAPATAELKAAAALVVTSFLATLSAAGFDNVFLYTLPVHSLPFAFTGILLGLSSNAPTTVLGNPWGWSRAYVWSQWRPTGSRPSPAVRAPQMFMTEQHGV